MFGQSLSLIIVFLFVVSGFIFLLCVCRGWKGSKQELQQQERPLTPQEKLIERYRSSPLTAEIVKYICSGNPETLAPTKIYIYDDHIQAHGIGAEITYDFSKHNIECLQRITKTGKSQTELDNIETPQLALAEAINSLLSNRYRIVDHADLKLLEGTRHGSGESYYFYAYYSNYVTMKIDRPSTTPTPPAPERRL